MRRYAAVDLGAQSGRVAVGAFDGSRLELQEVHRFPNVPVRTLGMLSWDVLRLYRDTLDGLRAAARDAHVASIGVDSWAIDFGLLDRHGRLLRNPVHYRDSRRAEAMERALEIVPARELYERTGIQLLPINTIFELAAMAAEHDPVLDIAETMLLVPDLLTCWLCGARASEFTNATTTQCFDPRARDWARDVLERLDVPTSVFPDVVEPGTRLGRLEAEVADETGLLETEVVAGATHDTASAVAAVPFRHHDSAFISAGTWSLVGLEVSEPVITDAAFAENVTNEGGVGGMIRLLRNVTGLWLLYESRRAWASRGDEHSFAELVSLAEQAPALRSFIDPDDPMFAEPGDMPARIRAFCARTRQDEPVDAGSITRCILESIALGHARAIRSLTRVVPSPPPEIHLVGGGSRNGLLCQWTADAAGLPVLTGPDEATLLGNILVQALAMGEIRSIGEGRGVVRDSFALTEYQPRETSEWAEARERFETIVGPRPEKVGV